MWSASLFTTTLSLLALGGARGVRAADNPDDASGKLLYITEPACGYYQCFVDWKQGADVAVNWLGPPAGSVSVMLISTNGGPTYDVVDSIAGISQEGYCDSGAGLGVVQPGVECGRIDFTVPGGWQPRDNYTIAVQSLSDPSLIGYTDNINVVKGSGGSGTGVQLATIPAPTSTNWNAAASFTGKIPDPTAVTGGSSKTKAPSSSADATSSSQQPSSSSDSSTKSSRSRSLSSSSTSSSGAEDSSSTSPASSSSVSLTSASAGGSLAAQSSGSSSSESSAVATAAPSSGAGRAAMSLGMGAAMFGLAGAVLL